MSKKKEMVTIRLPSKSWNVLSDTLLIDATSSAFDPKLRKEIVKARKDIRYVCETSMAKRLRMIVVEYYPERSHTALEILGKLTNAEVSSILKEPLHDLEQEGRI